MESSNLLCFVNEEVRVCLDGIEDDLEVLGCLKGLLLVHMISDEEPIVLDLSLLKPLLRDVLLADLS